MGGKIKKEVIVSRETLLENALQAAEDIINWYAVEHERSCYDEEDVPEDLRELENEFEKTKARLSSSLAERRNKL